MLEIKRKRTVKIVMRARKADIYDGIGVRRCPWHGYLAHPLMPKGD